MCKDATVCAAARILNILIEAQVTPETYTEICETNGDAHKYVDADTLAWRALQAVIDREPDLLDRDDSHKLFSVHFKAKALRQGLDHA